MILIDYSVRPSLIPGAGQGFFAEQTIPAGRILTAPSHIEQTVPLDDLLADPNHPLAHCSVRWFEQHCTVTPEWPDDCFINHSFSPNALWHLGFVFALREITPDEEITVDYRHLLGPGVEMDFKDSVTGRPIIGHDWVESLRDSTAALLDVLNANLTHPQA